MKIVLKTFEEMKRDYPDMVKNSEKVKELIEQNEHIIFDGDLEGKESVSLKVNGKTISVFINCFKPALQKKLEKIMDE